MVVGLNCDYSIFQNPTDVNLPLDTSHILYEVRPTAAMIYIAVVALWPQQSKVIFQVSSQRRLSNHVSRMQVASLKVLCAAGVAGMGILLADYLFAQLPYLTLNLAYGGFTSLSDFSLSHDILFNILVVLWP